MKIFKILLIVIFFCNISCAQSKLELLQGSWKENIADFESYVVVENNSWYSITVLDGEIDVSVELLGFYNTSEADSINPKNLLNNGDYVVFLTPRTSIKNYNTSIKGNYYKFYEYDINKDYFVYYANNPVALSKIDKLPDSIYEEFLERKKDFPQFRK